MTCKEHEGNSGVTDNVLFLDLNGSFKDGFSL